MKVISYLYYILINFKSVSRPVCFMCVVRECYYFPWFIYVQRRYPCLDVVTSPIVLLKGSAFYDAFLANSLSLGQGSRSKASLEQHRGRGGTLAR